MSSSIAFAGKKPITALGLNLLPLIISLSSSLPSSKSLVAGSPYFLFSNIFG